MDTVQKMEEKKKDILKNLDKIKSNISKLSLKELEDLHFDLNKLSHKYDL